VKTQTRRYKVSNSCSKNNCGTDSCCPGKCIVRALIIAGLVAAAFFVSGCDNTGGHLNWATPHQLGHHDHGNGQTCEYGDCNENGICDGEETDFDMDGIIDDCDPDFDGDGILNPCDFDNPGPLGASDDVIGEDCDLNGIDDGCESDLDNDGIIDACDEDVDGDDILDNCDIDFTYGFDCNSNNIDDTCELDTDDDGVIDACDDDDDNDGDTDEDELECGSNPLDADDSCVDCEGQANQGAIDAAEWMVDLEFYDAANLFSLGVADANIGCSGEYLANEYVSQFLVDVQGFIDTDVALQEELGEDAGRCFRIGFHSFLLNHVQENYDLGFNSVSNDAVQEAYDAFMADIESGAYSTELNFYLGEGLSDANNCLGFLADGTTVSLHLDQFQASLDLAVENGECSNIGFYTGVIEVILEYYELGFLSSEVDCSLSCDCPEEHGDDDDCEEDEGDNRKDCRKVAICHNGRTIYVNYHAVQAHLNHGDTLGVCPNN